MSRTVGELAEFLTYCNDQDECKRVMALHVLLAIGHNIVGDGVAFMAFAHNNKRCLCCCVKFPDGRLSYTLLGFPAHLPEEEVAMFYLNFMEHCGEQHGGQLRIEPVNLSPGRN
jgi:hypothetical protein